MFSTVAFIMHHDLMTAVISVRCDHCVLYVCCLFCSLSLMAAPGM